MLGTVSPQKYKSNPQFLTWDSFDQRQATTSVVDSVEKLAAP